ncbi:MAG TPA: AIR synthase-related protein, partial [Micavibrio sp.]
GDVVLAVAASGVHSNGYSLVRHVVAKSGLSYADDAPFAPGQTLGAALMTPTRIYVKAAQAAMQVSDDDHGPAVHAMAHITGGGLPGNAGRTIPDQYALAIDCRTWDLPPVFQWLRDVGGLAPADLAQTFNCGVGLVLVVSADRATAIQQALQQAGETAFVIGQVVPRSDAEPVILHHRDQAWA